MSKAGIYSRVSSEEQTRGTSLTTQRSACLAKCEAEGWEPVYFTDEGISGHKTDRPGWQDLLSAADTGEIDVIVVSSLDRFSRSTADAVGTIRRLHNQGTQFVSLKESIDLTTSAGKLQLTMLAGMAEFERDRIAERIVSGQRAKAQAGIWPCGFVPYGWRLSDDPVPRNRKPIPDEGEREVITVAVDAMLNDGMTTGQVAALLNGLGYRGRLGGAWTHQRVRRTLEAESLTGLVWWGQPARRHGHETKLTRKGTPLYGDPIAIQLDDPPLTRDRYDALRRVLLARGYGRKADAMPYPLSVIASTCCGGRLGGVTRKDRGKRHYRCSKAKWQASGASERCGCSLIDADWLDGVVWEAVVSMLSDPDRLLRMASDYLGFRADSAAPEAEAVSSLESHVARLEKARVDRAVEALKAGVPADVMAAAVAQIDQELLALRARLGGMRQYAASHREEQDRVSDLAELAAFARDELPHMTLVEQAEVLRLLGVSVALSDGSKTPTVSIRGIVPGGGSETLLPPVHPKGQDTPLQAPRVSLPFELVLRP